MSTPAVEPDATPPVTPPATPPVETPPAPVATPPAAPVSTSVDVPKKDEHDDKDDVTYTSVELEKIVANRVSRTTAKYLKEIAELKAGGNAAELTETKAAKDAAEKALNETKVEYAIRFAAVAGGVPVDQTTAIVKLTETSNLVKEGNIDTEAINAAVKATLEAYPGLVVKQVPPSTPPATPPPARSAGAGPSGGEPGKLEPTNVTEAVAAAYRAKGRT